MYKSLATRIYMVMYIKYFDQFGHSFLSIKTLFYMSVSKMFPNGRMDETRKRAKICFWLQFIIKNYTLLYFY